VSSITIGRAISRTYSTLITSTASLFKLIPKTLSVAVSNLVTVLKQIGKRVITSISSTVVIVVHFFFYKTLQTVVSSTTSLTKAMLKLLSVVSTHTATLSRLIEKLLSVVNHITVKLYPAFVQKFGAVAKFTFIVGPKKLMIMVIKDRDILVDKAEKTLIFVKNRVIMLYRKL